jgi:hypothetical protein
MKARAVALYPFVPSGPSFATSIEFFAELGFDKLWQHEGLAGLPGGVCWPVRQAAAKPAATG